MITRKHVELANKFYSAQDAMKALWGDEYREVVNRTIEEIRAIQVKFKCDEFLACKAAIEAITKARPYNNGMVVAMFLAAVVEMLESE